MSTLQFCSRCEGSILRTEPVHFTRRQQPLRPSCHVEYVAVGVVVALLIAGFAALMILR